MKSSGLLVASAIVFTGHCRLRGVSFSAVTAKTPTITIYDALSATGTAMAYGVAAMVTTASATNFVIKFSKEDNLDCATGLYASFSVDTTDGKCIVYYDIL